VLDFSQLDETRFRSDLELEEGRWIARVKISNGDDSWAFESEIK
jgi:nitrogen fixation protein FixH